jgi:tetrahydromethanopterin S-methyltransferase subunit C
MPKETVFTLVASIVTFLIGAVIAFFVGVQYKNREKWKNME